MKTTTLTIGGRPPVIGTFGKGVKGSVSINVGLSGGRHCDTACRHHPRSIAADPTFGCYAVTVEGRPDRAPLAAKLARHEAMRPDHVLGRAVDELHALRTPPPWVRVSTAGSLPADPGPAMAKQWRRFADYIVGAGLIDRHHVPVETAAKAAQYRALDRRLTIRESTQTWHRWIHARGAVSTVAGHAGMSLLHRIDAARSAAEARRAATGRACGVCPAVVQSFRGKLWTAGRNGARRRGVEWSEPMPQAAKCGQCRMCSLGGHGGRAFDVVYPYH